VLVRVAEAMAFEKFTVTLVALVAEADTSVGPVGVVNVVVDGFGLIENPAVSWTFRTVNV
jgi:hypothetical protein